MMIKRKDIPELPLGIAVIITALLMFFVVIPMVDWVTIHLAYGEEAYANGLRFENSKRGILTTGAELSYNWEAFRSGCFVSAIIIMGLSLRAVILGVFRKLKIEYSHNQSSHNTVSNKTDTPNYP